MFTKKSEADQRKKVDKKDYEALGKIVASVYETGYLDRFQSYKSSFIKGVLAGFGGVIGATVVVAFLLWALSFFNDVPLVGNFVEKVDQTIQSAQQ